MPATNEMMNILAPVGSENIIERIGKVTKPSCSSGSAIHFFLCAHPKKQTPD